jgi:hypothetical protein
MAMNGLEPMPLFEPKTDPTNTSARWTQWIQRFNTHLVASNVKDTARKRALLLYQAGPEVHEIFKTLSDTGDEKNYEVAVNALTAYFEPFSYPEPFLRAVNGARRGALAKSISNWLLIGHNEIYGLL